MESLIKTCAHGDVNRVGILFINISYYFIHFSFLRYFSLFLIINIGILYIESFRNLFHSLFISIISMYFITMLIINNSYIKKHILSLCSFRSNKKYITL